MSTLDLTWLTIFEKVRQTGLFGLRYKQKILYAVDHLEKAGLVKDVSGYSRFRPGKEQPKELTEIGTRLAGMIKNVEEYCNSFHSLSQKITKYFDVPYLGAKGTDPDHNKQDKITRNILRSRGFPSEMIDQSKDIYEKTLELRGNLSPAWIFSLIIIKYISILSKAVSITDSNKETKDIVSTIIMDSVAEYLSFILKDLEEYNFLLKRNQSDEKYTLEYYLGLHIDDFMNPLLVVTSDFGLLNNKIVESETTSVLLSILSISMHPDKIRHRDLPLEKLQDMIINQGELFGLYEEQNTKYKNKQD